MEDPKTILLTTCTILCSCLSLIGSDRCAGAGWFYWKWWTTGERWWPRWTRKNREEGTKGEWRREGEYHVSLSSCVRVWANIGLSVVGGGSIWGVLQCVDFVNCWISCVGSTRFARRWWSIRTPSKWGDRMSLDKQCGTVQHNVTQCNVNVM